MQANKFFASYKGCTDAKATVICWAQVSAGSAHPQSIAHLDTAKIHLGDY